MNAATTPHAAAAVSLCPASEIRIRTPREPESREVRTDVFAWEGRPLSDVERIVWARSVEAIQASIALEPSPSREAVQDAGIAFAVAGALVEMGLRGRWSCRRRTLTRMARELAWHEGELARRVREAKAVAS